MDSKSGFRLWIAAHKTLLQGIALLIILALPFLLYFAAQGDHVILMWVGIGSMFLVMIALIFAG